ncbi:putative mast cell-expressed membrane protein 1 like protein [Cricetulus griseus]|uniref:Putative mast cell-expressed membrane protein 1 like protein n=1 Tax=Cricetulus griseus TaxID=10029 RepID=A0A061I9C1_CRIGR|nr:putative mast cell-expressed membrane protein 1 like protein [Cricetulus griseus]
MCGHLGGPGPKAVVIYLNQRSRMQASASQDKNRRKPGHNEGAHNPDYENITLTYRNKDQLKLNQSAPTKQAQLKPSLATTQIPPWLHRTIMILYVLLALIFLSCIILSALVLVKNSEMSRELWSLRGELSNVSSIVLSCQNQQSDHWKAVQKDIQEAKNNIVMVLSQVRSGNDKLKTVPSDITGIKKALEALEKKALARKPGPGR